MRNALQRAICVSAKASSSAGFVAASSNRRIRPDRRVLIWPKRTRVFALWQPRTWNEHALARDESQSYPERRVHLSAPEGVTLRRSHRSLPVEPTLVPGCYGPVLDPELARVLPDAKGNLTGGSAVATRQNPHKPLREDIAPCSLAHHARSATAWPEHPTAFPRRALSRWLESARLWFSGF